MNTKSEQTAPEFLAELFEFETCGECSGDVGDHTALPLVLGVYGSLGVMIRSRPCCLNGVRAAGVCPAVPVFHDGGDTDGQDTGVSSDAGGDEGGCSKRDCGDPCGACDDHPKPEVTA